MAALLAYADSFSAPMIFDMTDLLKRNTAIHTLWPPWAPMIGTNRPLGLWSFAVNYALGGTNVWGYHAVNLAIHLAAAIVLLTIVRRTLSRGRLAPRFAPAASWLALAVALLWLLHPLQTQSVTYIYQRFESLMGLFFLLTLYCFIRGASAEGSGVRGQGSGPDIHHSSFVIHHSSLRHPSSFIIHHSLTIWYAGSVACCLLAVMTKEVAAAAPLVVLWYDRALVASSWREIVRRRWAFYLGLAGAWAALAAVMLRQASDYPKAGVLVVENMTPLQYALSQPGVIAHYLRLCVWPTDLCLDYNWPVADTAMRIVPPVVLIGLLLGLTVWAIFRWPAWSVLGGWFFLILAPTSSLLPIKDLAFEHRMYLPLAAVAAGVVIGGFLAGQWLVGRRRLSPATWRLLGGTSIILAALTLGGLTSDRNRDYRTEAAIWKDTADKAPRNSRAWYNLGMAFTTYRQNAEAIAQFTKALEIKPDHAEAENNLGAALLDLRRFDEAAAHCRRAAELKPDDAQPLINLGLALAGQEQYDAAIVCYEKAMQKRPDSVELYTDLAAALDECGRLDEAIADYQCALKIDPRFAPAYHNLGNALAKQGRFDEAIPSFQKAVELEPNSGMMRQGLSMAVAERDAFLAELARQRQRLQEHPDDAVLLREAAWTLATNPNASVRNAAEALKLADRSIERSRGGEPAALAARAAALAEAGRFPEAIETARKALELSTQQNRSQLTDSIQSQLRSYEAGVPFRQKATSVNRGIKSSGPPRGPYYAGPCHQQRSARQTLRTVLTRHDAA